MAASALSLSSAYKAVFQKLASYPHIFKLKILPLERPSESQSYKGIIDQILGYISFCFEISAHLGHLFA